ncbi:zinc finger protein 519-like [Armigeres subalbatus]|uniref:zinc finger protein 519-like n=1 Tax=Armigeres subalbatus TaxID=124917 RepID=UPI002ED4668B
MQRNSCLLFTNFLLAGCSVLYFQPKKMENSEYFLVKNVPVAVNNVNAVCRCCLTSEKLQIIFTSGGKVNGDLEDVLGPGYISVKSDDGLPDLICSTCVEVLRNWHRFRLKCDESYKLLERLQDCPIDVLEEPEEVFVDSTSVLAVSPTPDNIKIEEQEIFIEEEVVDVFEHKPEELNPADQNTVTTRANIKAESTPIPFALMVHSAKLVEKQILGDKKKRYIYHRQCPICGIVLKRGLREHLMIHNDPTGRPFKCDSCEKTYCRRDNLRQHQEREHLMIRYPCDFCGKVFSTRDVLNAHRKLHNTESFECDQCDQVFKSKKYLYKHKQKHLGIKKFICKYCGKSFLVGEYLKDHLRIHTGEKPFECKICGKAFRTTNHLRQHNRTHSILVASSEEHPTDDGDGPKSALIVGM